MTTLPALRVLLAAFLALNVLVQAADKKEEYSPTNEKSPAERLSWLNGPGTGPLDGRAKIRFPAEFRFLEAKDAKKFLSLTGNRPDGDETGILQNRKEEWWVIFQFEDIGYVKDDEKNDLNADKLLANYREGAEAMNERRKDDGTPPIHIVGWHVAPNYNDQTKNLEWSVEAESNGEKFVNYNVRLLGRKGVTKITLIEDRSKIDATLPKFREILKSHEYTTGESYAEYRQGDKIAKYGLGALVLGGTVAAAAKFGLLGPVILFLKKAWKFIAIGVVALGSWIKNLFTGRKSSQRIE